MTKLKIHEIPDEVAHDMLTRATAAKANTYPEPDAYTVTVLTAKGNIYEGVSI